MLVLTRKVNEKIMIGDDIVITLVQVTNPGAVRIGIQAPRDVPVRRLMPDGEFEGTQADWQPQDRVMGGAV